MKKNLILVICLLLFLNCDNTTVEEYFNRAIEFEEIEDYVTAISNLDKALEKDEFCRSALLNRGTYKSELGHYIEGLKDYKRILQFDADNTLALVNIAENYSILGNHEKAIHYYSKAINTHGALPCFSNPNGSFFINTNLDSNTFDNDMDFVMCKSEIQFDRGLEYYQNKHYDDAIIDFKASIEGNNSKVNCYFLIGESYLAQQDTINACLNYKEAAKLNDNASKEALEILCK